MSLDEHFNKQIGKNPIKLLEDKDIRRRFCEDGLTATRDERNIQILRNEIEEIDGRIHFSDLNSMRRESVNAPPIETSYMNKSAGVLKPATPTNQRKLETEEGLIVSKTEFAAEFGMQNQAQKFPLAAPGPSIQNPKASLFKKEEPSEEESAQSEDAEEPSEEDGPKNLNDRFKKHGSEEEEEEEDESGDVGNENEGKGIHTENFGRHRGITFGNSANAPSNYFMRDSEASP